MFAYDLGFYQARTKGIAKALRALGATKSANRKRIAAGKKPRVAGKSVSLKTFNKQTGANLSKTKAKAIQSKRKSKK